MVDFKETEVEKLSNEELIKFFKEIKSAYLSSLNEKEKIQKDLSSSVDIDKLIEIKKLEILSKQERILDKLLKEA